MVNRAWIFAGVFSAAFALNPGYLTGCASDASDAKFSYDEQDMAAVVQEVDSAGALPFEKGGARYVVHVGAAPYGQEVRRRLPTISIFAAVAHACGTRQFLFARPASACLDSSELNFETKLTVARTDRVLFANDETAQGQFWVPSQHLTDGTITLQTARVRVVIQAEEQEDGFAFEVTNLDILE